MIFGKPIRGARFMANFPDGADRISMASIAMFRVSVREV